MTKPLTDFDEFVGKTVSAVTESGDWIVIVFNDGSYAGFKAVGDDHAAILFCTGPLKFTPPPLSGESG